MIPVKTLSTIDIEECQISRLLITLLILGTLAVRFLKRSKSYENIDIRFLDISLNDFFSLITVCYNKKYFITRNSISLQIIELLIELMLILLYNWPIKSKGDPETTKTATEMEKNGNRSTESAKPEKKMVKTC